MTAETNDVLSEIEQELEESTSNGEPWDHENWDPDPGDTITGYYDGMNEGVPGYGGERFDVAHLKTEDGPKAVWLSSTVLQEQWKEADPSPGDAVGIKHQGKRESENGYEYNDFQVIVKDGDPMWFNE